MALSRNEHATDATGEHLHGVFVEPHLDKAQLAFIEQLDCEFGIIDDRAEQVLQLHDHGRPAAGGGTIEIEHAVQRIVGTHGRLHRGVLGRCFHVVQRVHAQGPSNFLRLIFLLQIILDGLGLKVRHVNALLPNPIDQLLALRRLHTGERDHLLGDPILVILNQELNIGDGLEIHLPAAIVYALIE